MTESRRVAEVIERTNAMQNRGVSVTLLIEWPDLIRSKRTFTDRTRSGYVL